MSGVQFGDVGGDVRVDGDVVGRDKVTHQAGHSSQAWRDEALVALSATDLDAVSRVAALDTVDALQEELAQETPHPSRLERYLNTLAEMGPDILDVVLAAARGPLAVAGVVVEKISEKAVAVRKA